MERLIDFGRERHMLCGICAHRWLVDLDWLDRWEQALENCPGCGVTCEHEQSPRVTVDPRDRALDDRASRLCWYHTSTRPDWPTEDFDPAAGLDAETRMRMGGHQQVARWAERQRRKALHVGTYEAAIHNMLRRIRDQAGRGSQFHLYRVHLKPAVVVREDWLVEPSDWVGDVELAEVCPPGVDVARYLNYHEDPGGLSLALGRQAIHSVRGVAVPLPDLQDDGWVDEAAASLGAATDVVELASVKRSLYARPSSARGILGRKLAEELAARLPINLRDQFEAAARLDVGEDPLRWARRTSGLYMLIAAPNGVLAALDATEPRVLSR